MTLNIDIGWLLAVLLVSIRVTGALALAPVLGPASIPAPARVAVTLALSALLVSVLPAVPVVLGSWQLVVAAFSEALVGASLAFGFLIAYAATQIAGHTLDVQMGFGAAAVLNPTARTPAAVLSSMLGMLAVAAFLALDGHHVLIRALSASLVAFPPGAAGLSVDWQALFAHSASMFVFGLALAGPVMIALLLADLGMAVIARSMPQLNVFVLSFSVKIVLGLLGVIASLSFARVVLTTLLESTFRYWDAVTAGP